MLLWAKIYQLFHPGILPCDMLILLKGLCSINKHEHSFFLFSFPRNIVHNTKQFTISSSESTEASCHYLAVLSHMVA